MEEEGNKVGNRQYREGNKGENDLPEEGVGTNGNYLQVEGHFCGNQKKGKGTNV
jgi:hypothetical protein